MTSENPSGPRDPLGTTYHESGPLWMGEPPFPSVTDGVGRFRHVSNAFCVDQSVFTRNIRNDEGEVTVVYSRVSGASGVTGSGPLLNLVFQAIAAGTAEVRVVDAGLRDVQMQSVTAAMPPLQVKVE